MQQEQVIPCVSETKQTPHDYQRVQKSKSLLHRPEHDRTIV